jgi:lysophospholipid acyltransferase (LPLAT)-like uncharacterized protein
MNFNAADGPLLFKFYFVVVGIILPSIEFFCICVLQMLWEGCNLAYALQCTVSFPLLVTLWHGQVFLGLVMMDHAMVKCPWKE